MFCFLGLCSSKGKIHANIVLIGDPKQLPPVTKSKKAEHLCFKITLMEHLLEKPLYKRDRTTGTYNPKYITQLVQNYRSHAAILKTPNELFYDNQLQASASQGNFCESKHWPIYFTYVSNLNRNYQLVHQLANSTSQEHPHYIQISARIL